MTDPTPARPAADAQAAEANPGSGRRPDLDSVLARIRAGDRPAWTELVNQYSPLVWAVARSHHLTHADADDVAQTTWLLLLENMERINPDALPGWLATTARRQALRLQRRSAHTLEASADPQISAPASTDDPAVQHERQERDELLWRAFGQLPERCQRLLRLLMAEGGTTTYTEISAALDVPIGSLGPTRARCLHRLRQLMAAIAAPKEHETAASPVVQARAADLSDADLVGLLRGSSAITDPVTNDVLEASRRLPDSARQPDTPD
jgi:RNA polymerase sigma factor (sigma-70 family)